MAKEKHKYNVYRKYVDLSDEGYWSGQDELWHWMGSTFAVSEAQALNNVQFFFPQPHQPWQRGTNENTNGLLREYFPKGTDLSKYSDEYIQSKVDELNKRPRKCLGYLTPYEVYYSTVLHLI